MTKVSARLAAIKLRKQGHSYNYIAPLVGVSKGTLAVWLADIPYTPNSVTVARMGKARAASTEAKSRLKRESFQAAREEACAELGVLTKRDLFMFGLGLYVGEGSKSTDNAGFVNANPAIIRAIIVWFTQSLGLRSQNIRIRLHLYPDNDESECLQFWAKATSIPHSQFSKPIVDRRTGKRMIKSGKLPHGTAHLTIRSLGEKRFGVYLARKIAALSELALEQ